MQDLKAGGGQLAQTQLSSARAQQKVAQQLRPGGGRDNHAASQQRPQWREVMPRVPPPGGAVGKLSGQTDKATGSLHAAMAPAQTLAGWLATLATDTTALMAAQQTALGTQLAYGNAILISANDAQTLKDKLKLSGGAVGLQTQAQRDSFGAAQTYSGDLGSQATQAVKSGHGVDAAIKAIRDGLPLLDSAKTKNKQYWQEVQTLVGWLDKLRQEKAISEAIHVSGTGVWSVTPGKIGLPGGTAGGPFPQGAGGMIRGGVPGRDSVLISAMPGEVVVPVAMVAAGLVRHPRGALPGFAGGGVVGSYAGNVAGLGPWAGGELNATVNAVAMATAQALVAGIRSASVPGFPGGPGGGSASANAALAQRMFPQWASGPLWGAWNYLAMRESGWSQFARNPSSGAYGIPQALPESKLPFAGQAAGGPNPPAPIASLPTDMP